MSTNPGRTWLQARWRERSGSKQRAARRAGREIARSNDMAPSLVCTIGHSNRPLADFIGLLQANAVERVLDVRTIPGSARNPQFNRETLADALAAHGVGYTHVAGLGGLRKTRVDSPNSGWRNASFRGYADYMQTSAFAQCLEGVERVAASERCALMCAEAVPWRCHRSLIADALVVRGVRVEHILGPGKRRVHTLTPFARVQGWQITYPAVDEVPSAAAGHGR